jgi:hypothetical protein
VIGSESLDRSELGTGGAAGTRTRSTIRTALLRFGLTFGIGLFAGYYFTRPIADVESPQASASALWRRSAPAAWTIVSGASGRRTFETHEAQEEERRTLARERHDEVGPGADGN